MTRDNVFEQQNYILLFKILFVSFLKEFRNYDTVMNAALPIRWNCRLLYLFLANPVVLMNAFLKIAICISLCQGDVSLK